MSIPSDPPKPALHTPAAKGASHVPRNRAVSGDAGGDAPSGSFLALLGDARQDALAAPPADASSLAQPLLQDSASSASAAQVGLLPQAGAGPGNGAAQDQGNGGAAALALAPALLAGAPALGGAGAAASVAGAGGGPRGPASEPGAAGRALRGAPMPWASRQVAEAGHDGTAAAVASAGGGTRALQQAGAQARQARDNLAAAGTDGADATGGGANRADTLATRLQAVLEQAALQQAQAAQEQPAPVPAALALQASTAGRPDRAPGERGRAAAAQGQADAALTGLPLAAPSPDYGPAAASVPVLAGGQQVAEQLHYWVTQHTQNAELQLEGLGQAPVQVHILVQGNEAQIAFRSDEAAARGLLESAGVHLKDMLQREGLVLTGVSVGGHGSSAGGSAGEGGGARARAPGRQAVVMGVQPAAADAPARLRSHATLGPGRALDLFV